jgi:FMN reductase
MNILVLSCSLDPTSRSSLLAKEAGVVLKTLGVDVTEMDLRNHDLPICDGQSCDVELIGPLRHAIEAADAIVMAVPVYNYDANAAAKNLVEWTGKTWEGKIVAFLCAAGGHSSYMSIMGLANSLMLDFRCLIVPRFVYATGEAFDDHAVTSSKVRDRIDQLCRETHRLAKALR